ncbi:MAG TPA: glycosyltransferase [Candidatus Sulfotelmatobacter sp.]|jgi:hypothetical protein
MRPTAAALIFRSTPILFATIFLAIFLLHVPLLRLPYFWDEAGYYVPCARDLLLTGSLIPHSTLSNAHPPLVMAWLAFWWKVIGYAPIVTRTAMLFLASFALLGVYRLAETVSNVTVAFAATLCTAVYPVFFAQSSLAQVDLAAAGFVFWGLSAFLKRKHATTFLWFTLAALSKETAILAPLALAAWEAAGIFAPKTLRDKLWRKPHNRSVAPLLLPVLPLSLWYGYHYVRTGYIFGNPEFFRYNVASTLNPTRFLLALLMRFWQIGGYLHLWVLTLAMALAIWMLPPLRNRSEEGQPKERPRISLPVQMSFYAIILADVIAMALVGGAVLARYMLPAVPLVIILSVSTLWRRVRPWQAVVAFVALAFVAGWFWNPPYGFSPEDNLAYRDYVVLHENAEHFLEARYPMARVLTAWPASDELSRPWLGYLTRPMRVLRVEDFSLDEMLSAADARSRYDIALVFSTKYEAGSTWWDSWQCWMELKKRFFGFHRDLPPAAAATILGGRIVFEQQRGGQRIAVIEIEQSEIQEAELRTRN